MDQIIEFIKENLIYIITVVILILITVIFAIVEVVKKRKSYQTYVTKFNAKKEKLESIEINTKLERLKNIGISNPAYLQMYERSLAKYNALMSEFNAYFDDAITSLNEYLENHKYKEINKLGHEINNKFNEVEKNINEVIEKINTSLMDADALDNELDAIVSRTEAMKDVFLSFGINDEFMRKEIEEKFSGLKQKQEIFKNYTLRGKFDEARGVLITLNDEITNLEAYQSYYGNWFNYINNVIPNKINALADIYNEKKNSDYPVKYLGIVTIYNDATKLLKEVITNIKLFKFENVQSDLESIIFALDNCSDGVKTEEDNKKEFDARFDDIYNEAKSLVEEHNKQLKEQMSLDKKFVVGKSISNVKDEVTNKYKNLQYNIRSIEDTIFTKQSYAFRLSKLKHLKEAVDDVKKAMSNSNVKYKEFEDSAVKAGKLVKKLSFTLRCLEVDLKNTNLVKLVNKYEHKFAAAFEYVITLNDLISQEKVDVDQIDSISNQLEAITNELKEKVQSDIDNSNKAEKLLLKANNYRISDPTIAKDVTKAEVLYDDGRIDDCIEALNETLNNIQK